MNDTLHKDIEETISNLYETKYFNALSELIANELEVTKTWLLNKGLSADGCDFIKVEPKDWELSLIHI